MAGSTKFTNAYPKFVPLLNSIGKYRKSYVALNPLVSSASSSAARVSACGMPRMTTVVRVSGSSCGAACCAFAARRLVRHTGGQERTLRLGAPLPREGSSTNV